MYRTPPLRAPQAPLEFPSVSCVADTWQAFPKLINQVFLELLNQKKIFLEFDTLEFFCSLLRKNIIQQHSILLMDEQEHYKSKSYLLNVFALFDLIRYKLTQ